MDRELKRVADFIDEGNLTGVTCNLTPNGEKLYIKVDDISVMRVKVNRKDNDMDVKYLVTGDRCKAITAEWIIEKIAKM